MFPKAPRFSDKPNGSDIPGPNSYDVTSPDSQQYKRGAMFEKDLRFRTPRPESPSVGDASMCCSICSSTIATSSKVKLDSARMQALEKEKIKMTQKITKLEEDLKQSQSSAVTLTREKKQLQLDLRMTKQKHEKSSNQQSSSNTSDENPVLLRSRIGSLSEQVKQQQSQIHHLQDVCASAESERLAAIARSNSLEKQLEAQKLSLSSIASNTIPNSSTDEATLIQSLRAELHAARQSEASAKEQLQDIQARLDVVDEMHAHDAKRVSVLQKDHQRIRLVNDDYEHDVEMLEQQRDALIAASMRLAGENATLRHTIESNSTEQRMSIIESRRLKETITLREEYIEQLSRQMTTLKAKLEAAEKSSASAYITNMMTYSDSESDLKDRDTLIINVGRQEDNLWQQELQQRLKEQEVIANLAKMNLQAIQSSQVWNQGIIERQQSEIKSMHAQLLALMENRDLSGESKNQVEEIKKDLANVEELYEVEVLRVIQSQEKEQQMQDQLNKAMNEITMLDERIRELEGMEVQLKQAKDQEEVLLNERQELLDDLARASNYESAYYSIRAEAQKILTNNGDLKNLATLRASLGSFNNQVNKIHYLDRIRQQLDESRNDLKVVENERNVLHKRCREMQERISNSNFEENSTGFQFTLSPPEEQVVLDEREAALRAWQQRPRSRLSRPSRERLRSTSGGDSREIPIRKRESPVILFKDDDESSNSASTTIGDVDGTSFNVEIEKEVVVGEDQEEEQQQQQQQQQEDQPKRRYLRAKQSDFQLKNQFLVNNDSNGFSPVASLPSVEALAWQLDKENQIEGKFNDEIQVTTTKVNITTTTKNHSRGKFFDGELDLYDLAG